MTTTVCSRLLVWKVCSTLANDFLIINLASIFINPIIHYLHSLIGLLPWPQTSLIVPRIIRHFLGHQNLGVHDVYLAQLVLSPCCATLTSSRVQSAKISLMCGMSTSFVEREKLRCVGPSWVLLGSAVFQRSRLCGSILWNGGPPLLVNTLLFFCKIDSTLLCSRSCLLLIMPLVKEVGTSRNARNGGICADLLALSLGRQEPFWPLLRLPKNLRKSWKAVHH